MPPVSEPSPGLGRFCFSLSLYPVQCLNSFSPSFLLLSSLHYFPLGRPQKPILNSTVFLKHGCCHDVLVKNRINCSWVTDSDPCSTPGFLRPLSLCSRCLSTSISPETTFIPIHSPWPLHLDVLLHPSGMYLPSL